MKKYVIFRVENSNDIIGKDTVYVHHRQYGGNVWIAGVSEDKVAKCVVTFEPIEKGEKCFMPTGFTPYKRKKISIKGMRILINQVKMKELKRKERLLAKLKKEAEDSFSDDVKVAS